MSPDMRRATAEVTGVMAEGDDDSRIASGRRGQGYPGAAITDPSGFKVFLQKWLSHRSVAEGVGDWRVPLPGTADWLDGQCGKLAI